MDSLKLNNMGNLKELSAEDLSSINGGETTAYVVGFYIGVVAGISYNFAMWVSEGLEE